MKRSPYPLQWPEGWASTPCPEPSEFTVSFTDALASLERELRRLGAIDPVITSNLPIRRDGRPYATGIAHGHSAGIAVYFVLYGAERVLACDSWDTPTANMRALAYSIEAIRGIDRWGAIGAALKVWDGFSALPAPAPDPHADHWSQVLGVHPSASMAEVKRAHRELIRSAHPDAGGDPVTAALINQAMQQAERYFQEMEMEQ